MALHGQRYRTLAASKGIVAPFQRASGAIPSPTAYRKVSPRQEYVSHFLRDRIQFSGSTPHCSDNPRLTCEHKENVLGTGFLSNF